MFALVSSLAFVAAALAGTIVVDTLRDSRGRITDALRGRPLPRLSPVLPAVA
jgi:hypothetical protein